MKSLYLFTFFFCLSLNSFSQQSSSIFHTNGMAFNLSVQVQADRSAKVTVNQVDSSRVTSTVFKPFTYDVFGNWLGAYLKDKAALEKLTPDPTIDSKVMNLFYDSITQLLNTSDDNGPIAGQLTIKPTVLIGDYDAKTKRLKDSLTYRVKEVQFEVLEGFLENITVTAEGVDKTGDPVLFANVFGIGFASKTNMGNLWNYWLIERNKPFATALRMNLGAVIQFDPQHEPGRRDYSPKDGRYIYQLNAQAVKAELRKDPVKHLIEARVYSDFVGLDKNNPNGLIQTEIFKRINMNTNRSLAFQRNTGLNKVFRFIIGQGVGLLQYVIPTLTLSKFEENNKSLLVNRSQDRITLSDQHDSYLKVQNGKSILVDSVTQVASLMGRPSVTALDLQRYQNFSAGIDLNLLYAENIGGKFNFYLDAGMRFGRTSLRDSTNQVVSTTSSAGFTKNEITKTGFSSNFSVNSFQIYPELKIQWLPEERFGVTLSRRWTYFSLRNGDYAQGGIKLGSYNYDNLRLEPENPKHWLGTWELFAFLKPSENGKLFFRYRLTNEVSNRNYNFNQAQVGYTFSILGSR